ncbi:MAG: hypothetical protein MJZ85_08740 [Bacteroidales bacterium]|nr:hypothetical protein [Bacteroidales bacterium]
MFFILKKTPDYFREMCIFAGKIQERIKARLTFIIRAFATNLQIKTHEQGETFRKMFFTPFQ